MRHAKKFNHLGRKSEHRKAMLANMTASLFEHKRIFTTLAKAKALRVYAEPLITKGKDNTTHSRRTVFSYLKTKFAIQELFDVIAPKVADRPGGYLRIVKTGFRKGDGAEMAMIEFVDFNEVYTQAKDASKPKKKRTRRAGKSKAATETAKAQEVKVEETKVDDAVEETKVSEEETPKAETPESSEENKDKESEA